MMLDYHPAVQNDFSEAVSYYEAHGGVHLADRFETEFQTCIAAIKAGPERFPFYRGSASFRRARLKNFPYVVVYRERGDFIRVMILKHERRHPRFGASRR